MNRKKDSHKSSASRKLLHIKQVLLFICVHAHYLLFTVAKEHTEERETEKLLSSHCTLPFLSTLLLYKLIRIQLVFCLELMALLVWVTHPTILSPKLETTPKDCVCRLRMYLSLLCLFLRVVFWWFVVSLFFLLLSCFLSDGQFWEKARQYISLYIFCGEEH